ncbi:hypothetical protein ACHQM5_012012 [Ranunculus cassubicifolius]
MILMAKRMRRMRSICSCTSPRSKFTTTPHPIFNCYEEDIWTEIAKYLRGKSLVMLGCVNRWFQKLIMSEEMVWKFVCLRDLQVPTPPLRQTVNFSWLKLYASAFDGSHSYLFRQTDKHIDWMRVGAFHLDSPYVFLTEKLVLPWRVPKGETTQEMLQNSSSCILSKIRPGIWIADIQLVRCPLCNVNTCEGTMQTLDARHIELFLTDGFKDGSWQFEEIGSCESKHSEGATAGIFDIKHLRHPSTIAVANLKSWAAKPDDWQPRTQIARNAVAVSTNLQRTEGEKDFHAS